MAFFSPASNFGQADELQSLCILPPSREKGCGVVTTCFVMLNLVQDPFCRLGLRMWGEMDPEPRSG
ncbi:hypothetical protein C7W88_10135 [Novosphingobium sp. THN1]|nr:hypothetical protein C7W88_10135 [Novosphingobium sp. THN1]